MQPLEAPPASETIDQADQPTSPNLPDFLVAGVGASAGGLEAYTQLLRALPDELGMAIVVVQHLAPHHDSILPDLLSAETHIPVLIAAEGMAVEPNHIYIAPPNAQLSIMGGKLHLWPRPEDRNKYLPIDFFFRSLAEYAQDRAVGVILSGTASDGAAGLREVKANGGIVLVQDPKSARYDGMPRAAITTGIVDLVLAPREMADELLRISKHPLVKGERRTEPGQSAEAATVDDQLARIFLMLRNATGVDFTHYKLPTIKRRLQRRMVLHKLTNTDDYVKLLQQNSTEIHNLYQDILIHVTRFFRDPESFAVLTQRVFPRIVDQRQGDVPLRIWVPGCSTGEEPYSVAISLLESLGENAGSTPIQIFATDVSETAIEHARAGLYPESITADVSAERLRRFFNKVDGSYRVSKIVRDTCIFARQDLTRDPPFSKLDLIVCRNVLIYLGPPLQKRLMSVFHYALKPSGFLMLGGAETVGAHADMFNVIEKRHKLYMKKIAAAVHHDVEFPPVDYSAARAGLHKRATPEPRGNTVQNEANRVVLSRYAPPGVLVDNDLQIVQFRGQTGPYLEPAPGEASLNLLKMAREGLLYGLRTALHEARKSDAPVRKEGLRVKTNGRVHDVSLEVVPLSGASDGRHFLILFEDRTGRVPAAIPVEPPRRKRGSKRSKSDDRVAHLQDELAASREYLQSIIQDLEAANEELQSANEEILSSNEELQSTNEELDTAKEELQSTNEELNTVNEELSGRNDELSRANSDLVNLLGNVQIAIVMVASDLRIRRFTPMAEKVLNLIATDVGRPISDIKPNIECDNLEQLIQDSIDTVTIKEKQVQDRHGNWYSLRIRPYKNLENRIDGAVLALIDRQVPPSDDQRDQAVLDSSEFVRVISEALHEPMILLDADLRVTAVNGAFCDAFGIRHADAEGRRIDELGDGELKGDELKRLLDEVLQAPDSTANRTLDLRLPLDSRTYRINVRRFTRADSRLGSMVVALSPE